MTLGSSLKKLKLKPFWLFFIRSFNPAPTKRWCEESTQIYFKYNFEYHWTRKGVGLEIALEDAVEEEIDP